MNMVLCKASNPNRTERETNAEAQGEKKGSILQT